MTMSTGRLVQSLDFFESKIPSIADGGLDPTAAIARIREYLINDTDPRDHELLNWRFDAILDLIAGSPEKASDEVAG